MFEDALSYAVAFTLFCAPGLVIAVIVERHEIARAWRRRAIRKRIDRYRQSVEGNYAHGFSDLDHTW